VGRLKRELNEARDASMKALSEERKLRESEILQASDGFKLAMDAAKRAAVSVEVCVAQNLARKSLASFVCVCSPPFARVLKLGYAFLVSSVQIESEERHAEELRTARSQLERRMQDAEDALKGDVARLEAAVAANKAAEDALKGDISRLQAALTTNDGCMRGLEHELSEARQMGRRTADDIAVLQRDLNQSRSEAVMLQRKLTTAEAEIEKNKARFAEELEVVASVARSAAASSALASDMAPTAADAAAAQTRSRTDWSKAANDLARHSKDAAAKEPGSAPGKFKLRLKKASEGMQEELSIAEQGLKNRSELDVSFVSDENTSAQDSPEKTRAHSPFDEREMLSRYLHVV